jgi:N,N'-diacetylchitobiose transport system substrate-binding protein
MKVRLTAAAVLVALLSLAMASATGARLAEPQARQASDITVWLMGDAQSNWPEAVAAANQAFGQKHPGVNVKVQYQTWGDYKTKFEATLAAGSGPDVIEFGNTDTPKYTAAGALAPLDKGAFPNSGTWLSGLAKAGSYNGKTFAVPYYAGARGVIYRTDQYKAAGIKSTPKSLAEFQAAGQKLMAKYGGAKDPTYSAVYFPGRYWYAAMSFVYDYGGQIAKTKGGKWVGTLHEPAALSGLTAWRNVARSYSRANKTGSEANPQQALVFAKGSVGSFVGNGWEWPYALDTKVGNPGLAGKIGAYPMPSHTPGKYMPTFLGGSDLAVPITSKNRQLAIDWLKEFTGTDLMRYMATVGKVLPNTTSLASVHKTNKQVAPFARAASASWFVPAAANWVNVENKRIIRNMLVRIFSGRESVASAAKKASRAITTELNRSS